MGTTKKVKLSEIARFIAGQSPESKYFSRDSSLTPFMQGNKSFGRLFPQINNYTSKIIKIAKPGDILISVRAQVGDLNISNKNICIGRGLGVISGIKIDNKSLYFVIKNNIKNFIKKANGSTFSSVTKDDINNMELIIPEKGLDNITNLLWKIESKITMNQQINDNLLSFARKKYMHYFFKKTANGKIKNVIFEAEKSKILVGQAKTCNGKYPFFTSGSSILSWDKYFVDGRYCFLNTGGNADVKFYVGKSAYSTDAWCISANNNMADYLYLLLLTIKEELGKKYFKGTSLKHLQKELLKQKEIYIPTNSELLFFNKVIQPMFDLISKNTKETLNLIGIRDFLLPLLMNGQVEIN
ncbi:Type I restriction modification DNA specificity domain [Mesomycoplasma dispar]|uniref:Type I restriction modification DNA specificity domain n=1 Tax=Mesomycoplasma dispar TaxID=86660 RepID=A0AAJ5NKU1_9BACT|nr:restriction endonuclease subunit S [Mesomycoplasma dispar]AJR12000.1 restriction endonuclease subunit S [Mesomycoplasma dispar]VEU61314.1 Type I restriction modification DNA specificity domain [Mesomycoplasma dispar]